MVLRYPGGKSRAAGWLVDRMPKDMIHYLEPMIGGGSVFLEVYKRNPYLQFQISDLYQPLVSFWKQMLYDRRRLALEILSIWHSHPDVESRRKLFHRLQSSTPTAEIDRAVKFFILNRMSFSGCTEAGGFSQSAAMTRFTFSSIERLGKLVLPRQLKVQQADVFAVLESRTGFHSSFFFLDPPYFTAKRLYGNNGELHSFDHERLAEVLKQLPYKFMLTYDDCPEIRRLYADFNVVPFELQYGMSRRKGSEVLIVNYSTDGAGHQQSSGTAGGRKGPTAVPSTT